MANQNLRHSHSLINLRFDWKKVEKYIFTIFANVHVSLSNQCQKMCDILLFRAYRQTTRFRRLIFNFYRWWVTFKHFDTRIWRVPPMFNFSSYVKLSQLNQKCSKVWMSKIPPFGMAHQFRSVQFVLFVQLIGILQRMKIPLFL